MEWQLSLKYYLSKTFFSTISGWLLSRRSRKASLDHRFDTFERYFQMSSYVLEKLEFNFHQGVTNIRQECIIKFIMMCFALWKGGKLLYGFLQIFSHLNGSRNHILVFSPSGDTKPFWKKFTLWYLYICLSSGWWVMEKIPHCFQNFVQSSVYGLECCLKCPV